MSEVAYKVVSIYSKPAEQNRLYFSAVAPKPDIKVRYELGAECKAIANDTPLFAFNSYMAAMNFGTNVCSQPWAVLEVEVIEPYAFQFEYASCEIFCFGLSDVQEWWIAAKKFKELNRRPSCSQILPEGTVLVKSLKPIREVYCSLGLNILRNQSVEEK